MDSPDQRAAINRFIGVLRRATLLIKAAPFAYLLLFSAYMLLSPFVPDELLCIADGLFVASPAMMVLMVILSRIFHLCRWHVIACLIPGAANIETVIDSYVVTMTINEVIAVNMILGTLAVVYRVSVNRLIYGRKEVSARIA